MDYLEQYEYRDFLQCPFEWRRSNEGYYWEDHAVLASAPYIKPGQQLPVTFYRNMTADNARMVLVTDGKQRQRSLTRMERAEFGPPFLIPKDETRSFIFYRPSDDMTLFLKFARLEYELSTIAKFADAYGNLTRWYVKRDKDGEVRPGDPLSTWRNEIEDMKWTVQVWEWLRELEGGDPDGKASLCKVISWSGGNLEYALADTEILDQYGGAEKLIKAIEKGKVDAHFARGTLLRKGDTELERFVHGDVVLPAQFLVQTMTNLKMRYHEVSPQLLLNADNEFEPAYSPRSLIGALWLQFYLAAFGKHRFRRCQICSEWEDVTERSSNWTKHPECANRERAKRAYYKKKKEKQVKATATKGRSKK